MDFNYYIIKSCTTVLIMCDHFSDLVIIFCYLF